MNLNKDNIVFKCIVGSNLYGTSLDTSDIDTAGVFLPSKRDLLSFVTDNQTYKESKDNTFYEIRKFFQLANNCNPTIIELLFVPEDKVLINTPLWESVLANRDMFLSKKAKHSFLGYAHAQLTKIKTHRKYLLDPPKEKPIQENFGLKTTVSETQYGAFNAMLAHVLETIQDSHQMKEKLIEMQEYLDYKQIIHSKYFADIPSHIIADIVDNKELNAAIHYYQKYKAYKNELDAWTGYSEWKRTRNPDRAKLEEKFGYDTKHAAHLFRLLQEGKQILLEGRITFPLQNAEEIIAIRKGKYKYEEILSFFDNISEEFDELYVSSRLPHKPDFDKIENFLANLLEYLYFIKGE